MSFICKNVETYRSISYQTTSIHLRIKSPSVNKSTRVSEHNTHHNPPISIPMRPNLKNNSTVHISNTTQLAEFGIEMNIHGYLGKIIYHPYPHIYFHTSKSEVLAKISWQVRLQRGRYGTDIPFRFLSSASLDVQNEPNRATNCIMQWMNGIGIQARKSRRVE